jgi:hypothetical protein
MRLSPEAMTQSQERGHAGFLEEYSALEQSLESTLLPVDEVTRELPDVRPVGWFAPSMNINQLPHLLKWLERIQ